MGKHRHQHGHKPKKPRIPQALRQQTWIRHFGKVYKHKCHVKWCTNNITVFNYECGHNIPLSKNGPTVLSNLRPICSTCNKSMSNTYTIDEWNTLGEDVKIE